MAEKASFNMKDIDTLDEQIKVLLSCKPLPESDVKTLCERVSTDLADACTYISNKTFIY